MLKDFPFFGFNIEAFAEASGLSAGNKAPGISLTRIYDPKSGVVSDVCVPEK